MLASQLHCFFCRIEAAMANLLKPLQYLLLLVCLFCTGKCSSVKASNDDQLEAFLKGTMNNYTNWLQENQLDPSPLTNDTMSGHYYGVRLDCQLFDHYVNGYSKIEGLSIPTARSNFSGHTFHMGRQVRSIFEFHGNFTCTGSLLSDTFLELDSDVPFSGHGNFLITTNLAFEYLLLENVGITQDYKLDLSQSWATYRLETGQESYCVKGEWNETLASGTYSMAIENTFAYRYRMEPLLFFEKVGFPTGVVLDRFVRQVAANVDLKDIIIAEDLPTPFVPTPKPGTTTASSSLSG